VSRIAQTGTQVRLNQVPNNLPHDLSSFVGRDDERSHGSRLLRETRLLTLTGPGGAGKTRLAQHIAADALDDFPDGVWLAELASLNDAALVPQAVALAVGIHDAPGRAMLDTLADSFGSARVLLALDNCEHLVHACAELTQALLRACPRVRVLATSREPLGVAGEVTWVVPPLSVPAAPEPLDELLRYDAVRLFVERASAVRPAFALNEASAGAVSQICRRLDGMPLALELAAARMRSFSAGEIAERLDDRFALLTSGPRTASPRQQTLRGALDWSYELLSPAERDLFASLSVFSGGFDLDAVRAVCGPDLDELLARLVDRSLVIAEPVDGSGRTRYRLLETVRAYAWQRLVDVGDADRLREQHAAWILHQSQGAERAFRGPDQGFWLRWTEREHDNVRAALAWSIDRGAAGDALRLCAALAWSWSLHMRWSESRTLLERVLAMPGAQAPSTERARVLLAAGTVASFLGDIAAASTYLDAAHDVGRALDNEFFVLEARGSRQLIYMFQGEQARARLEAEALLALTRQIGYTWAEVRVLEFLAQAAAGQGEHTRAVDLLEEGARIARRAGDAWSLARCLETLGDVERSRGEHARAARLYSESQALFAEIGLGPYPGVIHNLGYLALAEGDRRRAAASFAEALAAFRRVGDRRGAAECVIGLGCVLSASGSGEGAARLFAAGHAALEALGSQLWASNRADYERWLALARGRLSAAELDRSWATGRGWSLDDAVLEAQKIALQSTAPRTTGLLTTREREVAQLVARGLTNRQIAETLVVTEKTAANHVQRVLDKLEVHSRSQLASRAAEFGLLV
jgi:predicted ATPase/DNA-binding CsgD family transcriptional regulator